MSASSSSAHDVAPSPRSARSGLAAAEPPPSAGATGLRGLAGPLCLVLLAGLALPPHFGLALPLVLLLVLAVVGQRRVRQVAEARATLGEGAGGSVARGSLLVVGLGAAAVLCTVLARGVGVLLVEYPAALWAAAAALVVAALWAVAGAHVPARARPVVLLALALLIPAAGVYGTRHEAAGSDARGWAHSGPILGIHPFQMTAVIVDGHGPFDLPINDYVEPKGDRGYGPTELADALDRALESIAERVYPDGPLRVRRALIDAEVEAVQTPAVWERLDREPHEETQPRFIVRSGSFGSGSRIEFVCPGRRLDPRGPQGESVMNRMCPDKYAAEASAGLGVTGRWSGYSEGRGNPRSGLSRWQGWTRGDDAEGRKVVERETRLWAWIVLGLVALVVLWRRAAPVGEGVRGIGGALGLIAVTGLVVAAISVGGEPMVGWWSSGPSWISVTDLGYWTPAFALGGLVLFSLEGAGQGAGQGSGLGGRSERAGAVQTVAAPAVLVVVATLALATSLPALHWIFPVQSPEGAHLPRFVQGVAEVLGERGGLTIFEVEGAIASTLAAILLAGTVATASAASALVRRLAPASLSAPLSSARRAAAGVALVLVAAAALVLSRKTAGAAALMPGVIGMTLVLGSGLLRISRPDSGRGLRFGLGLAAHFTWTALALGLVWAAVQPLPSHPFVLLCGVLGVLAILAASLATAASRPRSAEPASGGASTEGPPEAGGTARPVRL